MKLKKLISIMLAGTMVIGLTACGGGADSSSSSSTSSSSSSGTTENASAESGDTQAAGDQKLVVWTLAKDLETFAEKYMESNPDVAIETVVIEPANYVTKVQTALNGGQKEPDIIVGEPQMLEDFYDAGYFEDLNQAPYNAQDYADQIVDYVWKVGQDSEGIQRAISYQITPAGIYYRRDIAQEVFGTDDPDEIGKLFADYATILTTAQTLKDAGYRIFASDAEINYFSGDSAWVIDGTLNVDQGRYDYMDLCVSLYQNDLTAYANQWSTPWYQAMAGEVPILSADIQNYADDSVNVWDPDQFAEATADMDKTSVFAFGLPSWGVLTMRDNVQETSGKWGVCSGPSYGFGGGTFIGISSQSERKDLAWDFLKFCTLNEDTANWWIEKSEGDTVSLVPVLNAHAEDANEVYGGQQLYKFWLEQAEGIDYSKVTRYDKAIGDAWASAITAIKTGEKSKEDAINEFYDVVESTYPEITVNR
ncbi:MAG: carbohydrate ABC transporter substrate-binding protein [Lachnospiraceae bacterium]|nr:carbohydrate ABC transporter substrate-binding protein [Lachnospiraceae bacterium]